MPIVIFSYYNPILALGDAFLEEASKAGANGILIVDSPFEQMPKSSSRSRSRRLHIDAARARREEIAKAGRGFIYYACQKGTTGMRGGLPAHSAHDIARIKQASALPVAIGFGISNRQTASEALALADGFVVGSYFVDAMSRRVSPEELTKLAKQIDPRSHP